MQAAKQSTNATLRNLIYIDMEQVDKIEAVSMVEKPLGQSGLYFKSKRAGLLLSKRQ